MSIKDSSKAIVNVIGGKDNITQVGHCATRLRINVKDLEKINKDEINDIPGVHGHVIKGNQLQVIIGTTVGSFYQTFVEIAGYNANNDSKNDEKVEVTNKNFKHYVDVVGGFFAEIFMPIVPALVTGGLILAFNNLLINYFGIAAESGTAKIILSIFSAAFGSLPIFLGYTTARKFKLQPIMGAFLGALLVNGAVSGVEGLDFFGIPVTTVDYFGSVLPVIMGVIFMYYVDKLLNKIIPEFGKYILVPLLTIFIVFPVTLIVLGPIGTMMSGAVGSSVMWIMDTLGFLALPLISIAYPYMVMLGIDKALMPIGFDLVASIGYDPFNMVVGFISNVAIGATALAVAYHVRKDKKKSGAYTSFGLTGLFGITEPAFYGALIGRPKALIGTAIGAGAAGLFAGIVSLKSFVMGGGPGLFTLLFFMNPDGSMNNFVFALIAGAISIIVSFVATIVLLNLDDKKKAKNNI